MSEFQNVHKFELKAGVIITPHNEGMSFNRGSDAIAVTERETEFYLKSEADKVIAEKEKELRHQKYKRCLDMADLCFREYQTYCALIDRLENFFDEKDFYERWHKRWLELAEKFKEGK